MSVKLLWFAAFLFIAFVATHPVKAQEFGPICDTSTPGVTCEATSTPGPTTPPAATNTPGGPTDTPAPTITPGGPTLTPYIPVSGNTEITFVLLGISGILVLGSTFSLLTLKSSE